MKMILAMGAMLALLYAAPSTAADETPNPLAGVACDDMVKVQVNGLVCDFCAQALEYVFGEEAAVKGIHVDLDKALVTVGMKEGQTMDNAALTKLIMDAGYNVEKIDRGC